jgi:hypothetical protein
VRRPTWPALVRRPAPPDLPAPATPVPADPLPPAMPGLRAAVHASGRLSSGLAREWRQEPLRPGVEPDVDVVLVELADGLAVPEDVRTGGAPLVVWATAALPAPAHADLLDRADLVYVALASQLEAWRAADPRAVLLPPAASARVRPTPPAERHGIAVVLDGPVEPHPAALTAAVLVRGLRPLVSGSAGRPELLRVARLTDGVPTSRVLRPAPEVTDGADVAALLSSAAVVADGPRRAVDDTWTVLDAAASGAAAATVGDLPVPEGLPVPTADDHLLWRGELVALLHQRELRDREALRLARAVRRGHALGDRVARVADDLGLPRPARRRTVSAVVATNRPAQLDHVLASVGRQEHPGVELVLVLHGLDVDHGAVKERAVEAGVEHLAVVDADPALTLGACLNLGIDAASGDYLAKLDDDNHYGVHYLADLVDAFDGSGAGVVGKWAHHVWLQGNGAVVLRYPDAENTYQRRVQGGSMVFDGDLLRRLRFGDLPRGVDTDVLDRVLAEDVPIFSADRFNFVSVRDADVSGHTWSASDTSFLTASGRLLFHGDPRPHVEV